MTTYHGAVAEVYDSIDALGLDAEEKLVAKLLLATLLWLIEGKKNRNAIHSLRLAMGELYPDLSDQLLMLSIR